MESTTQTDALRALVELVPDLEELRLARQVPEVDLDGLPLDSDGFHPKVHTDCTDVPCDKLSACMQG